LPFFDPIADSESRNPSRADQVAHSIFSRFL